MGQRAADAAHAAFAVAVAPINGAGGDGVGAGVGDRAQVGGVEAAFVHAGVAAQSQRGSHVVHRDGGAVLGLHRVAVVVLCGSGDSVRLAGRAIPADRGAEGALVGAARGDGLRHDAGPLPVQVTVDGVRQDGQGDGFGGAGVGHPHGEGHRAARLHHAGGIGGLADGDGGQHVIDGDGGGIFVRQGRCAVVCHPQAHGVAAVVAVGAGVAGGAAGGVVVAAVVGAVPFVEHNRPVVRGAGAVQRDGAAFVTAVGAARVGGGGQVGNARARNDKRIRIFIRVIVGDVDRIRKTARRRGVKGYIEGGCRVADNRAGRLDGHAEMGRGSQGDSGCAGQVQIGVPRIADGEGMSDGRAAHGHAAKVGVVGRRRRRVPVGNGIALTLHVHFRGTNCGKGHIRTVGGALAILPNHPIVILGD